MPTTISTTSTKPIATIAARPAYEAMPVGLHNRALVFAGMTDLCERVEICRPWPKITL